jgi:hypothetical protein
MQTHELESDVAAILTGGSLNGPANHAVDFTVTRYRAIIDELRKTGGLSKPVRPVGR